MSTQRFTPECRRSPQRLLSANASVSVRPEGADRSLPKNDMKASIRTGTPMLDARTLLPWRKHASRVSQFER